MANNSYGDHDAQLRIKKLIVKDKMPVQYVVPRTIVQATGAILSNWNVNSLGTGVYRYNTAYAEFPPYACKLSVTANVAGTAAAADNIRFRGWTAQGKFVQEDVAVQATAAGRNYTNYAFAKIKQLQSNPAAVVKGKSTSVAIGYNPVTIGLPHHIAGTSDVLTLSFFGTYGTTV